jgi:hypothetical protein
MRNLWNFEAHIRETSDVIAQGLILPVPYPLEIVLVSRLLVGSNEIFNERLAQFLLRVEGVFG